MSNWTADSKVLYFYIFYIENGNLFKITGEDQNNLQLHLEIHQPLIKIKKGVGM